MLLAGAGISVAGIRVIGKHRLNGKLPVVKERFIKVADEWRTLKHGVAYPEARTRIKFANPKKRQQLPPQQAIEIPPTVGSTPSLQAC